MAVCAQAVRITAPSVSEAWQALGVGPQRKGKRIFRFRVLTQASRSAVIGSIRVARRAGT
jgi:hypothetical protein